MYIGSFYYTVAFKINSSMYINTHLFHTQQDKSLITHQETCKRQISVYKLLKFVGHC